MPSTNPYLVQVPGTGLEQPVDPAEYLVGPGDIFMISIVGLRPYLVETTVTPTQKLMIPDIGSVNVENMTAEEVAQAVLNKIEAMYPSYVSDCFLYGIREIRVSLSGAIEKPALYRVTPLARLSDLLAFGDSLRANAALHRVEIRRAAEGPLIIDFNEYLYHGDLSNNPVLQEGDQVNVPFSDISTEMIIIGGMATIAQYFTIKPGESLLTFMERWDSPEENPNINVVEIHRKDGKGSVEKIKVTADRFDEVVLKPGDMLYVDRIPAVTVIGEVNEPGRYEYQPGYSVTDYIAQASGITEDGSSKNVSINRLDGQKMQGIKTMIEPGDIIHIGRSFRTTLVGQSGLIQVAIAVFNIILIAIVRL